MKKRKISLWLNIVTICLSVCSIAIGVYSLTSAKLDISGSLGFTAHYVTATIDTTIKGSALNGTSAAVDKSYPQISFISSEPQTSKNLALDTRYFTNVGTISGKPEPIKVYFHIKNTSIVPIKATVTLPDSISNVERVADKESIKIDCNASGTIVVTFFVVDYLTEIPIIQFKNFAIEMQPFDYSKSDIEVKFDPNGLISNYYIEYGTNKVDSSTKLKWYIFGTYSKMDSEAVESVKELVPATDFNFELSTSVNSGKILKESVVYAFISNNILPSVSITDFDIPYNNNIFALNNDKWGEYYSNEYTNVGGNDYSISTIRAYLNGKTINKNVDSSTECKFVPNISNIKNVNFYEQNPTLKTEDVYTLIKPRTLKSLYSTINDTVPETMTDGIEGTDADAFWIVSSKDLDTNKNSNCMAYLFGSNSAGIWFIREKGSSYTKVASDSIGSYSGWDVMGTNCGVRPSFII